MRVKLLGRDGLTLHAYGQLEDEKLGDAGMLRHSGHLYTYRTLQKGVAVFHEADEPWEVTGMLLTGAQAQIKAEMDI